MCDHRYTYTTEEYRGLTIRITQDDDPMSPREDCDNFGVMVCFHNRYNLGDVERPGDPNDWAQALAEELDPTVEDRIDYWENGPGWQACINRSNNHVSPTELSDTKVRELIQKTLNKHAIMLPLFLYDHSGISMSTASFVGRAQHAEWDSGQIGWTYIPLAKVREEYSTKRVTQAIRAKAIECLKAEVQTYDDYLRGNVWGFEIEDEDGEHLDSCWGFFGDPDKWVMEEAKACADYFANQREEELFELRSQETAGEVVMA